ncbi:hypothetical protein QAD02_011646 [Eretmocerus hayati]|uniref:Uncharacterized protein n=1 Tax=Eretmocerus hayati TaxID=131215 RepID=A0ACC2NXD1_9HYME|nr:hypothetical protein QAD02_011646 [Eretmocerus hayati]
MELNLTLFISLLICSFSHSNEGKIQPLSINDVGEELSDPCRSKIYCEGDLLHAVQLLRVFGDSKEFVDLPMKRSSEEILTSFVKLIDESKINVSAFDYVNETELARYREIIGYFIHENFGGENELMQPANLTDWRDNPSFIEFIQDDSYKEWAYNLNEIWKNLAREMSENVRDHPERHSLIYVNNSFVVPGGRFKEFYYWDTYWVIEGLLLCEMYDTVRGMIENFLSMVERYGFIPNGGRIYYLSRSQPPLLIPMVYEYFRVTNDIDFVNLNLDTLEEEFQYWMRYKSVKISKDGKMYSLSRYVTHSPTPRPESYREDYDQAEKLTELQKKFDLYNNIKAGAESGWDFSSRWFADKNGARSQNLDDIVTSDILPVDLNAFIQRNAKILSKFFYLKGDVLRSEYYKEIAVMYQDSIEALLWNEEDGTWYDLDMKHGTQRKLFYLSNLTPLYTESYDENQSDYYGKRSVEYLKNNEISKYSGMPTSLCSSQEQWDFPNVWAPLQSIVVEGLRKTNNIQAVELAEQFAINFLYTTYHGYQRHGKMYEKYNATNPGESGQGGEYQPQDGFGWTNAVVLHSLFLFLPGGSRLRLTPKID